MAQKQVREQINEAVQATTHDLARTRELDPNVAQRKASNPLISVWVNASAGSGKTKVLTDRVLRLLLPREDGNIGTAAHKILCLTFTKAGASEMALRISKKLSKWAVLPLEDLQQELQDLLGRTPGQYEIDAARQLFAQVVDTPGGMKIMTIHSFCQSVLGRFPLEAGLSPHFTVLEEAQASALLSQARDMILSNAEAGSPLKEALDHIAGEVNEDQFFGLIRAFAKERYQLSKLMARHWDPDGLYTAICDSLGIQAGIKPDDIILEACGDGAFDEQGLRQACAVLAGGTEKTDQPKAAPLQNWLDSDPEARLQQFGRYQQIFLTTKNEIRKTLITKAALKKAPECEEYLHKEGQRLQGLQGQISSAKTALLTRDLFILGQEITEQYQSIKQKNGTLDFDDLIMRTLDLLKGRTANMKAEDVAPWVMYKLDQGLDHILIDEAQDTNPEQWQIIAALCEEFFSGVSARDDISRSVFTVGDEKQSIYSFQRAAPEEFQRMQIDMAQKIAAAEQQQDNVGLNISFRSTESVLKAVDQVFSSPDIAKGLGLEPVQHLSFRRGQEGLVELWPLFESEQNEKRDPWTPPVDIIENQSGPAKLGEHIGDTIKTWLDSGEVLPSHGRAIQPGDIMILLRTRTGFFEQLVRSLKTRDIPVSGVDRMVLNEQLAVQDLLALASFALLPEDDLTLACILKSPLIGWDEQQLYDLAVDRNTSLWNILYNSKEGGEENLRVSVYLKSLIKEASKQHPFEFFSSILQSPCPADDHSGLRAMKARLGDDVIDPLDELLRAALQFEQDNIPTLQGFLHWQERGAAEIKRELEESGGQVRIMTVHGSKGLQAPIVILPDTTRLNRHVPGQSDKRLLWPQKSGLDVPLWSPRKDMDCKAFKDGFEHAQDLLDEEYRRLFYVAMTRAEDRLYIGGYKGSREILPDCWYNYAKSALEGLEDAEKLENGAIRLTNPQIKEPDRHTAAESRKDEKLALPDWLHQKAPEEPDPPAPLIPSRPSETEPAASSPLEAKNEHRFRRGNITHKLLQFLPDLPADKRLAAAQSFVEKHAADLPDTIRSSITQETIKILEDARFTALFEPGSMAEVPITGLLPDGRLISGQIDRLVIQHDKIWIIDYKTNRPPPSNEKDIPQIYRNQMKAYADTLRQIYPDRAIEAALLWSDGPFLMPISC